MDVRLTPSSFMRGTEGVRVVLDLSARWMGPAWAHTEPAPVKPADPFTAWMMEIGAKEWLHSGCAKCPASTRQYVHMGERTQFLKKYWQQRLASERDVHKSREHARVDQQQQQEFNAAQLEYERVHQEQSPFAEA